jgi:Cu(I)/Ag(I) efflux system membrane fusion protein
MSSSESSTPPDVTGGARPEGGAPGEVREEPTARALRVMAGVRWALFVIMGAIAAGTWWTLVLRGEAAVGGEARFYCPMHPQITSPAPGTCPVCFMQLEPIASGGAAGGGQEHGEHAQHDEHDEAPVGATVMLTTERRQASGIAVVPVTREPTGEGRRWPAVVEPVAGARSEVRVRTTAFVERVVVRDPGVAVRRGQILAWVVAPEIAQAEEELLAASRWDEPRRTELVRAATRRLALLGVSEAEAREILASGTARSRIPLRAPTGGTLLRVEAAVGVTASPESVLYEIADLERVWVAATILSDDDVPLAREARAHFVARGAAPVPLSLALIEPLAEPGSRGARARFVADAALRPGDVGEVVIEAAAAPALLVPRDAVLDRGLARYVFVEVEPGTFAPRVVRAGALRGERREILEGLAEGERVVARGGFVLDSESRLAAALAPRATPRSDHAPADHAPADDARAAEAP